MLLEVGDVVARRPVSALAAACLVVGEAEGIGLRIPESVTAGTDGDPIRSVARYSGVRTRRVVLQGEWWASDGGAMVGYLEEDRRPIALLPCCTGLLARPGYTIFDPATGESRTVDAAAALTLHGYAHVFYRGLPPGAISGMALLRFGLRGCGRDLAAVGLAGLAVSLLALVLPLATGYIFEALIPGGEGAQLAQMAVLILASALASTLFGLVRAYALLRVEGRADYVIQAAVWDRLLNLPATFFRGYSAGDLASRSLAVSQIRGSLNGNTLTALIAGVFSALSAGLLFYYSVPMALVAVGIVLTFLVVTVAAGYLQLRMQGKLMSISGRLAGMVFGIINGVAKLRVTASEDRAFDRWATAFASQKQVAVSVRKVSNSMAVFSRAFPVVAACALYWTMSRGSLPAGQFLAFVAAFGQLMAAAQAFGAGVLAVLRAAPVYERIRPILSAIPEQDGGKVSPGDLSGAIEVRNVSFAYAGTEKPILRDVSLTVQPGEFIAIVGASGSGKSTLMRLLLAFEMPDSGAVLYDGQDLRGLDLQEVRRQLGTVLQDGRVMPGDILTNIIGSAQLTVEDAWAAARLAGLEDDLKALPMGMFTLVSEGGRELSGGQRQRLMIARAFATRPRILLFDEATSALDNRTQEIVSAAMEQSRATRVVIAHRLSTIQKADRILVLDGGRIVEQGTFEELLAAGGFFAALASRQLT